MANLTGLSGATPTPDLPERGAASAAPRAAFSTSTSSSWLDDVGSFFSGLWHRISGRGGRLRREDGPVAVGSEAKAIIAADKGRTFDSPDAVFAAYEKGLHALDRHFAARLAGGETGSIDAEARRADFQLTQAYVQKARDLAPKDLAALVDRMIEAKTGLSGLNVSPRDYRQDMDADGLKARAELLRGTSDFQVDTDHDGVTDLQEVRAHLDPTRPRTEVGIDSDGWDIHGYVWYPYFDDKPVMAFAKYDRVFGTSASDEFEPFFGAYSAGGTLGRGTWLPNSGVGRPGYVRESDFARTSGVNPIAEPLVPAGLASLVFKSGAPQQARFALRGADGTPVQLQPGDQLRPTYVRDGKVQLAEARSVEGKPRYFKPGTDDQLESSIVAYRAMGLDGTVRGSADAQIESRQELFALDAGLPFDFLDERGQTVDYTPARGDKIAFSFQEGDQWIALCPNGTGGTEKRVYEQDGKTLRETKPLTDQEATALRQAHPTDGMYRVVDGQSGALRGDGSVSGTFDAYWWGKCHNTAKIDQSNLPQPDRAVRVAQGVEPGETLVARFSGPDGDHLLQPIRSGEGAVTAYAEVVGGQEARQLTPAEAKALATEKGATPAILSPDGAVRAAAVVTVSPEEVQTLVAHMGSDATTYKGAVGSRFYGTPDVLTLQDGSTLDGARILSAKLASGESVEVQTKVGPGWRDMARGLFRGADIAHRKAQRGYRSVAFRESSMASINAGRADAIAEVTVLNADGTRQTIPADQIRQVGREEAYDLSPADIWAAQSMIEDGRSFTLEKATGPQVWNYAVKALGTERIDRSKVPAAALKADDLPGALAGTTDKKGRLYFTTDITYLENGEPHEKRYHYWVKMDAEGKVTDYNYLVDPEDTDATFSAAPDFFWQTHVKDPVTERWGGESEVAGASMSDIQGLYNASVGNMDHVGVLGVFSAEDLAESRPRRPE